MNSISKSENPYASPRTQTANANAEEVLLEIKPTVSKKLIFTILSIRYISGVFYFTILAVTNPFGWDTLVPAIGVVSLSFSAFAFLYVLFDRQVYTKRGIQISKTTQTNLTWEEIESWHTGKNGRIQIVTNAGYKPYLNTLGPSCYNHQIAEILNERVGPKSD